MRTPTPFVLLLAWRWSLGNDVCGQLRRRSSVYHCVCILDADAVRATVSLHDVHDRVVCVCLRPIALPFEHHGQCGNGFGASLNHALHRIFVSKLADVAAAIFDHIDFVAVVNGLDGWQRDAGLCPQSRQNNLFPTALFDRGNEVLVIPGIHRGTLDWDLVRKYSLDLRPKISAETLALHRAEDDWEREHPCRFR